MTLRPAYGRDYKSKAEVLKDWNEGKDFAVADMFHGGGTYVTKKELETTGETVFVRYAKDRKITQVK